ncbi:hypothetical protein E2C01_051173 [Portunus trituberculatus]|uniref:Uncharacterized protein n=1 Tax=Portunus trituberculatus TaxID=210409 RepID=A0A5B7GJG7_PORTR|nr:hypothetical protein [Portunus trituberculatus]
MSITMQRPVMSDTGRVSTPAVRYTSWRLPSLNVGVVPNLDGTRGDVVLLIVGVARCPIQLHLGYILVKREHSQKHTTPGTHLFLTMQQRMFHECKLQIKAKRRADLQKTELPRPYRKWTTDDFGLLFQLSQLLLVALYPLLEDRVHTLHLQRLRPLHQFHTVPNIEWERLQITTS